MVKFVSYKELRELCADLKEIYSAPTEEAGRAAPEAFGDTEINFHQIPFVNGFIR